MMQKFHPLVLAVAGICLAVGGFLVGDVSAAARSESQMTGYDFPGQTECNLSAVGGMLAVDPRSAVDHVSRGVTYYLADKGCSNGEIAAFNQGAQKIDLPKRGCRAALDENGNVVAGYETCADVDRRN